MIMMLQIYAIMKICKTPLLLLSPQERAKETPERGLVFVKKELNKSKQSWLLQVPYLPKHHPLQVLLLLLLLLQLLLRQYLSIPKSQHLQESPLLLLLQLLQQISAAVPFSSQQQQQQQEQQLLLSSAPSRCSTSSCCLLLQGPPLSLGPLNFLLCSKPSNLGCFHSLNLWGPQGPPKPPGGAPLQWGPHHLWGPRGPATPHSSSSSSSSSSREMHA